MKKDIEEEKNFEDTLDYYNESIPINAVGSLLNKSNDGHDEVAVTGDAEEFKEDRIKETFVRGFEREGKEEAREYLYNNKADYTINTSFNRQRREVKYPEGYEASTRKQNKTNSANINNKMYAEDYAFNYAQDDVNEKSISALKIMGVITLLIFLSILVFLVYRVNSVTRQLEYVQAVEASTINPNLDVEILLKQRDELVQQVAALEFTVADLQQQVEAFNNLTQNQENSNNISMNQVPVNPQLNGSRTHMVQQGDNLSTISEQFYGTRYDYQRIVDANNLQTDLLDIGQILIIP